MKIILVILYLWSGQVKLEQEAYKDDISCRLAAAKRVAEIQKDPRFEGGFGAWCVAVSGEKNKEANKSATDQG